MLKLNKEVIMKHIFLINRFSLKHRTDKMVEVIKKVCKRRKLDFEIDINNNSFSTEDILNKYKNTKHIIMKTDNRKLFEYSLIEFTNYGYKINEISLDLYQDDTLNNIPTEYEIKFHNQGFPIYKIDITK